MRVSSAKSWVRTRITAINTTCCAFAMWAVNLLWQCVLLGKGFWSTAISLDALSWVITGAAVGFSATRLVLYTIKDHKDAGLT